MRGVSLFRNYCPVAREGDDDAGSRIAARKCQYFTHRRRVLKDDRFVQTAVRINRGHDWPYRISTRKLQRMQMSARFSFIGDTVIGDVVSRLFTVSAMIAIFVGDHYTGMHSDRYSVRDQLFTELKCILRVL